MIHSKPQKAPDLFEHRYAHNELIVAKFYTYKSDPDHLLLEASISDFGKITRHIPILKIKAGDYITKVRIHYVNTDYLVVHTNVYYISLFLLSST